MSACLAEFGPRDFGRHPTMGAAPEGEEGGEEEERGENETDQRIRQRLEACRQGMAQLEALRTKHQRLMQNMRQRLPSIPAVNVKSRPRKDVANIQAELKLEEPRCESPLSSCVSHRSSVSIDSGCVSITSSDSLTSSQPPMPYSTYRKLSMEERCKNLSASLHPPNANDTRIVATVIESTTAMRTPRYVKRAPLMGSAERNERRPRSLYSSSAFAVSTPERLDDLSSEREDDETSESSGGYGVIRRSGPKDYGIDMATFSQITPPPVQRKFAVSGPPPQRSASHAQLVTRIVQTPATKSITSPPVSVGPTRLAVNSSPVTPPRGLQSPATRPLRTAPQRRQAAKNEGTDPVFHASRVFVEGRTPPVRRVGVRPKSMIERAPSTETDEEEEDRPVFAQPAIVLSRQQSYNTQSSESTSPGENRRFQLVHASLRNAVALSGKEAAPTFQPSLQHRNLDRSTSGESTGSPLKPRKGWYESEGL